jgi:adenine-specific DNA-methyltransferase
MKAFATANRLVEKEARALAKSKPDALDTFVLKNARSVIQLARPDYDSVSLEARKLIDLSEKNPETILRPNATATPTYS